MSKGSISNPAAVPTPPQASTEKDRLLGINKKLLAPITIIALLVTGDVAHRLVVSYWTGDVTQRGLMSYWIGLATIAASLGVLLVTTLRYGIDKRYLAPILISCILFLGDLHYGVLESYWATILAILASIVLETALSRFVAGRWPHLASAYITGISVGILIRSPFLWPYIMCSLLSISSKYALRINNRHLWNPSNLGVSVLLLLAPTAVAPLSQQWGNEIYVSFIILGLGSLILYSLGRLHITLAYVIAFSILSWVRSSVTGQAFISEIGLLTAPAYQLFMFFMITDPKTTTRTKTRQCAVAVLVAVVETLLRLYGGNIVPQSDIHAPYYALFIVAPVTNFLEICWDARFGKKPVAGTGTAKPVSEKAAALVSTNGEVREASFESGPLAPDGTQVSRPPS